MKIRISWALHELLWLEAAMSLNVTERDAAFHDIAGMTGRTYSAVRTKAYDHFADILDARAMLRDMARRSAGRGREAIALKPSCIAPPTRARLMGARA